jgi:hypothetical protein
MTDDIEHSMDSWGNWDSYHHEFDKFQQDAYTLILWPLSAAISHLKQEVEAEDQQLEPKLSLSKGEEGEHYAELQQRNWQYFEGSGAVIAQHGASWTALKAQSYASKHGPANPSLLSLGKVGIRARANSLNYGRNLLSVSVSISHIIRRLLATSIGSDWFEIKSSTMAVRRTK